MDNFLGKDDKISKSKTVIIIDFFPSPLLLGIFAQVIFMIRQRHRGWLHLVIIGLFGIYLMLVVKLVIFPVIISEDWPENLSLGELQTTLSQAINLVPFNYGNMFFRLWDGSISCSIILREIGGNILLTIPFGFGINRFRMIRKRNILGWAIATGLILEGAQLLIILSAGSSMHSVDINDVMLNALGVLIGYEFYQGLIWTIGQLGIKRS